MGNEVFFIKVGDTSPDIEVQALDADGVAVNTTGAGAEFHLTNGRTGVAKIAAGVMVAVDAATGRWKYVWVTGDTDTAGQYVYEMQITFADASIETFPNTGHNKLRMGKELG